LRKEEGRNIYLGTTCRNKKNSFSSTPKRHKKFEGIRKKKEKIRQRSTERILTACVREGNLDPSRKARPESQGEAYNFITS
jgi:hypothetical protein